MRRLHHLLLSPSSRLARLMVGEKRLTCDPVTPDDIFAHLPVFIDMDVTRCEGLWAIVDHLEGGYPEHSLVPEDAAERGGSFRFLDWAMNSLQETVTKRIVFEIAAPRFTGGFIHRAPDMNIVRQGREAL